jgi:glutaconate CoA-transferase subunit A
MREAVSEFVRDGDTVAIEGFTHLICHAAGHEIIRQGKRRLTLSRLTPDIVADQLVAAGSVERLIFSWMGNPGVGSLHAIRRAVEAGSLDIEEWTHFAMVARYQAGASGLPFLPIRSFAGSDLPAVNPLIRTVEDPYGGGETFTVPALHPDVAIVACQRADSEGNAQIWGLLGCQREAAHAADRVIVVCEELVDSSVIRSDPNRTVIAGYVVDAVVVQPWSCHPSFAQGYSDRDNEFYLTWDEISRDAARLDGWIDEWIRNTVDHSEYLRKLGPLDRLRPHPAPSEPVDYGRYA